MVEAIEKDILMESHFEEDVILSVNKVSKRFCRDLKRSLLYGVQDITGDLFGLRKEATTLRPQEFWALRDVSFQLRRGEALGLVGKNGSGKSTLLRIIAGLIKPDSGSLELKGRIAPLIALGAGFNPVLTGRENVYANMSILGLTKKEIDAQFDAVVEFAEIGDAIDSPVQSYSSGMAARLGFASAIHTEPDILLIDEVLAVGDIRFRIKCYRRLAELSNRGVSFILVSHNANSVLSVCDSAVLLSAGKIVESGDPDSIMEKYEECVFSVEDNQNNGGILLLPEKLINESLGVDITYVCFKDKQNKTTRFPMTGEIANLCVGLKSHKHVQSLGVTLLIKERSIESNTGLRLSTHSDSKSFNISLGEHEVQLKMPCLGLKPGSYVMKLSLDEDRIALLDAVESFNFTVKSRESMSGCSFYQSRIWKNKSKENAKAIRP